MQFVTFNDILKCTNFALLDNELVIGRIPFFYNFDESGRSLLYRAVEENNLNLVAYLGEKLNEAEWSNYLEAPNYYKTLLDVASAEAIIKLQEISKKKLGYIPNYLLPTANFLAFNTLDSQKDPNVPSSSELEINERWFNVNEEMNFPLLVEHPSNDERSTNTLDSLNALDAIAKPMTGVSAEPSMERKDLFWKALERGDIEEIRKYFLPKYVNTTGPKKTRPLHEAIKNSHVEAVEFLIKQGADPTLNISPSLTRSKKQKQSILEYANKKLKIYNHPNTQKIVTILNKAILLKESAQLEEISQQQIDDSVLDAIEPPMAIAPAKCSIVEQRGLFWQELREGNLGGMKKYFLPHLVNTVGPTKTLPLHQAIKNGDVEAVKFLIKQGADPTLYISLSLTRSNNQSILEYAKKKLKEHKQDPKYQEIISILNKAILLKESAQEIALNENDSENFDQEYLPKRGKKEDNQDNNPQPPSSENSLNYFPNITSPPNVGLDNNVIGSSQDPFSDLLRQMEQMDDASLALFGLSCTELNVLNPEPTVNLTPGEEAFPLSSVNERNLSDDPHSTSDPLELQGYIPPLNSVYIGPN